MSGPIVRKYGFPNFDQIFGKRDLEHGQDEPDPAPTDASDATKPSADRAEPGDAAPAAPDPQPNRPT